MALDYNKIPVYPIFYQIRTIVFWGLYWGPLIQGNCHIYPRGGQPLAHMEFSSGSVLNRHPVILFICLYPKIVQPASEKHPYEGGGGSQCHLRVPTGAVCGPCAGLGLRWLK